MKRWSIAAMLAVVLTGLGGYFVFRRAPNTPPVTSPGNTSEFADSSQCATCHPNEAEAYKRTGMGRSFFRPATENTIEDYKSKNTLYHVASDRHYTLIERNGRFYQRRHQIGFDGKPANVMEDEIHYVIGSGNHARTYLHLTDQKKFVELPIAWYSENGGYWGMNPGYDWKHHSDFRRKITMECVFCHNGYPETRTDSDRADMEAVFPGNNPEGIDCQRCHGPGAAHVKSPDASNIINPARLSRVRNLEVCMQCHLETTSAPLPYAVRRFDRGVFSYKAGEPLADYMIHFDHAPGTGHDDKFEIASSVYRLQKSLCFQRSEMTCTTCHNPHDIPRGEAATERYVGVCQSCHGEAISQLNAAKRHPLSGDCLGCHMPKRRTDDVVHAVMTDHYIQRRKPARDLLAKIDEHHEPNANAYRGEVVSYYPPQLAGVPESELYASVAQVTAKANLREGTQRLANAVAKESPRSGAFYFELGQAYADANSHDLAINMYQETLKRMGDYWPALHRLGLSLMRAGRPEAAVDYLERASNKSTEGTVHSELGLLYRQLGRVPDALRALKKAVKVDPRFPPAHHNLGGLLLDSGDLKAAEESFREAIRLQPDLAASHASLGRLLMNRSDFVEARFHFARAIREAEKGDAAFIDAHMALGGMDELDSRLNEAIGHYRAVIDVAPDFHKAHLSLGSIFVMQGNRVEARSHLEKAATSTDINIRQSSLEALRRLN
jgi:predicted CXXCH cytochrome family protein